MEQEIWHDDLYATRDKPVKQRQCKHKSCVKFASSEQMVVYTFTNTDKKELGSKLEKAMQLERLLDYEIDDFGNNAMHVAELYKQAGAECKSKKLKDFCDTRRKLNANKATIWRRENNVRMD